MGQPDRELSQIRLESILLRLVEKAEPMPAEEILQEAKKLHAVSASLDVLAKQHAPVAEALAILSGNVRSSANFLRVVVALKLGMPAELNMASN
jgi:hypothetical protein